MKRWAVFVSVVVLLVLYNGLQFGLLAPGAPFASVWAADVAFFWCLIGWQIAHRTGATGRSRVVAALGWVVAVATGLWATFILLSLPIDLAVLFRLAPPRAALWTAAAIAAGFSALGLRQALAGPLLREASVPIEGLPAALEGLRIVQLSDLHVGPTIGARYLGAVVDQALALKPDLIALTGDIADGKAAELSASVAPLARLKAPLGVYYVTGNHEYYWGAEPWIKKFAELGLIPLIDEHRLVEKGGATLLVGGVPDTSAAQFVAAHASDPRRAAGEARADFKLLLAHRPDSCVDAEAAGFQLQLSGHTHGGQFFPFSLLVGLVHRYREGLHRHGKLWVYVNSGTGYWGPPHRFAVPSEITLLTLVRA